MSSRMLSQHQVARGHTYRFLRHDLVTERIADHAVLVYSGFMSKSIASNNSLIRLHRTANDRGEQLARRVELRGLNGRFKGQPVGAHLQGHYDLFERGVT